MVAIVDDDQSAREGIGDLVNSLGFDAETFERAEHFLVAAGKRIPTIVITAFPKERERQRALQAGIVCFLAKPFDEAQLVDCITSALSPDCGR